MRFTDNLLEHFRAISGAASVVTKREATGDKGVTIDLSEKAILYSLYPKSLFTRAGGAVKDGKPTHHSFNVHRHEDNKSSLFDISVKHPKAKGRELRLNFNRGSNFYPPEGSVWYIFTREGVLEPFIGFMSQPEWENIASGDAQKLAFESAYSLDEDDDSYQKELHSPQAQNGKITNSSTRYKRNPSQAASVIKKNNYKCQFDPTHDSFVSASSGNQYVEVHHLIPISKTDDFTYSLDVPANLIVLCPNCHKTIHLASEEEKVVLLNKFYQERVDQLERAGIAVEFEKLCDFYGIKSK